MIDLAICAFMARLAGTKSAIQAQHQKNSTARRFIEPDREHPKPRSQKFLNEKHPPLSKHSRTQIQQV